MSTSIPPGPTSTLTPRDAASHAVMLAEATGERAIAEVRPVILVKSFSAFDLSLTYLEHQMVFVDPDNLTIACDKLARPGRSRPFASRESGRFAHAVQPEQSFLPGAIPAPHAQLAPRPSAWERRLLFVVQRHYRKGRAWLARNVTRSTSRAIARRRVAPASCQAKA